jgi:stearoyl-CoA desaturase (delta-9 desaturase)
MHLTIFIAVHWYTSLFLQSFFHHRYSAHNLFVMTKFWERFFFIACFIVHGSSYLSPTAYAIMHRLHHAHTDTEKDPHSPHHAANIFHMLLKGRHYYYSIFSGKSTVEDKYRKGVPTWLWFDKMAHNWVTRSIWVLIYVFIYVWLTKSMVMYVLLPVTIAMSTIQGAVVNWWAHSLGYKNFAMNNASRNILPIDILFCGEAYHNNHHKYPGRPNNAHRWFEFDITYYIVRMLHTCRVIRLQ